MKRTIKILAVIIAVPILLFIIAAIVLASLDLNAYREPIGKAISDATGRQLTLKGELGKSFFPWLGVKVGQVGMSNAPGFKHNTFAAVELAEVRVDTMSLLKMQPAVDKIVLHGLAVNLARTAEGKTNWDDLVAKPAQDAPSTDTAPQTEPDTSTPVSPSQALAGFVLGGIDIRNARIQWDDAQAGAQYAIHDANISLSEVKIGKPLKLNVSLKLDSNAPGVSALIELSSEALHWDLDKQRYQIKPLSLKVNAKGEVTAGGATGLELSAPVDVDLEAQRITLLPLNIKVAAQDGHLEKGNAELTLKTPVDIDLGKQLFNLPDLVLNLNAQSTLIPGGNAQVSVQTPIEVDLQHQRASLANLLIKAMGLEFKGALYAQQFMEKPALSGTIKLAEFNPKTLLTQLAIELPAMADTNVLQKAALSMELKGDFNNLSVNQLQLSLDDTTINGHAGVAQFDNPKIMFDLTVNGIDIDRYLPPPLESESAKTPAPVTPVSTASAAAKLPVEPLRAINMDGKLNVGSLTASKITTSNLVVGVKAAKGNIRLQPFDGEVSGGKFASDITLGATGDNVKVSLKEDLQGVQVEPLLKALIDNDLLSGAVKLNADLSTGGEDVDQLMAALNGRASFQFKDGAVKGFNLAEYARQGQAKLKGQSYTPTEVPKQTDFTELTGTATINNGIVEKLDIEAKAPGFRIQGEGTVDLIDQSLNYLTTGYIVATSKGQGGAELDDLKGIPIPVRLKGPFTALQYELDYDPMLKAYKERIKKQLDDKKQEVKEQLKEKQQEAKDELKQQQQEIKQDLQDQKDEKLEAEKARLKQKQEEEKQRLKERLKKLF